MKKKLLIASAVLLNSGLALTAIWLTFCWPPPRILLKYGTSPQCTPTGRELILEGIEFIEIGPGVARIGSEDQVQGGDWLGQWCARVGLPWGDQPESTDEMPARWVEFEQGIWIAKHEVTNQQFERFRPGHERSEYSPGDCDPVVEVSWEEATAWCAWTSAQSRCRVRLPSEAEWEAACRGGSDSQFCFGDGDTHLADYAWFAVNSEYRAHAVASRQPNSWGLFDLHGNVWEWCEDIYRADYMAAPKDGTPVRDAGRSAPSVRRVRRGGSWMSNAGYCRSAYRGKLRPGMRENRLGFRPCLTRAND